MQCSDVLAMPLSHGEGHVNIALETRSGVTQDSPQWCPSLGGLGWLICGHIWRSLPGAGLTRSLAGSSRPHAQGRGWKHGMLQRPQVGSGIMPLSPPPVALQ